jgi:hypothetical protein
MSIFLAACAAATAQAASAQVVGHQPTGITVAEADAIVSGRGIKRSILRKPVFNEDTEKVGTVYDIVVCAGQVGFVCHHRRTRIHWDTSS